MDRMRDCLSDWKAHACFNGVNFKFLLPFDLGMYETHELTLNKARHNYIHTMESSQNLPFTLKPTLSQIEMYSLIHKIAEKI